MQPIPNFLEVAQRRPSAPLIRHGKEFWQQAVRDQETSGLSPGTAYAQPSPLPKCNADASLLAQILTATFADHVPLNRQSMIFGRHGFPVPRSTLDDWKLGSAELLEVLQAPLIAHTLSAPRLHSDDTTVQLRDASKDTTHTSRLWAYLGAGQRQDDQGQWVEHPPSVVFEFTRTRQGIHPQQFLKDYRRRGK